MLFRSAMSARSLVVARASKNVARTAPATVPTFSSAPVLSPVVLLFCIFPSSNEPIKRRRFNKDQALVAHRDRSELHRRIGRARRSHRLHDRLDMADRQGNTAIPVHQPCAVERWYELRWKDEIGRANV